MVNYGVSRGCDTCKKKRKKCDLTRPSCERCQRAKHICPGYRDEADLIFRNITQQPDVPSRVVTPWWYSDSASDEYIINSALNIFVDEFIVTASNRELSRGFLDGMQHLLRAVHPESTLARAARLVVLASVGNRSHRPKLVKRSMEEYGHLLSLYHKSLSSGDPISVEDLYTAVLLGIFEVVVSNESSPARHLPHVRGVGAIISKGVAPLDPITGVNIFQMGNALLLRGKIEHQAGGVLCAPINNSSLNTLDEKLLKFGRWFYPSRRRLLSNNLSIAELQELQSQGHAIDEELASWGASQSSSWMPTIVGTITQLSASKSSIAYCHAGTVHRYVDYYVAAVWNTYRKCHILLLDLLSQISQKLNPERSIANLTNRVPDLLLPIIQSIPFHLAADVDHYVASVNSNRSASVVVPNRPVGGLLLLHPLYAATKARIIPQETRQYFGRCLAWMGSAMGIGQAKILSKAADLDFEYGTNTFAPKLPFQEMGEGHVLIWAGMLLQPPPTTQPVGGSLHPR